MWAPEQSVKAEALHRRPSSGSRKRYKSDEITNVFMMKDIINA